MKRYCLLCGFRPFFMLTAASAALFMLMWLALLNGWLTAWSPPGGPLLWHAHELLFGFAGAATAGFTLTAIPEFTRTPAIKSDVLARLALLWLLSRGAYLLSPTWPSTIGLWPVALANLVFWLVLLQQLLPRLWRDPGRPQLGFAWAIAGLAVMQQAFFSALALDGDATAWLRAATGMLLVLIVVATSRISMAVINGRIEEGRPGAEVPNDSYLARPPRRNLAVFCMLLCCASELLLGQNGVSGWVALATAAAVLNLLNDWHVGRPLFNRWALMLYASYWLIALGYATMGIAWLGAPFSASSGRHLLAAGAISLSIFTVMMLVGRIHAGLWLDRRLWLPLCAAALVLAALLRALAGLPLAAAVTLPLLNISGLLWAACFVLYLWRNWSTLNGPREDGQEGCAEPSRK